MYIYTGNVQTSVPVNQSQSLYLFGLRTIRPERVIVWTGRSDVPAVRLLFVLCPGSLAVAGCATCATGGCATGGFNTIAIFIIDNDWFLSWETNVSGSASANSSIFEFHFVGMMWQDLCDFSFALVWPVIKTHSNGLTDGNWGPLVSVSVVILGSFHLSLDQRDAWSIYINTLSYMLCCI